jgi:hypothetical protein
VYSYLDHRRRCHDVLCLGLHVLDDCSSRWGLLESLARPASHLSPILVFPTGVLAVGCSSYHGLLDYLPRYLVVYREDVGRRSAETLDASYHPRDHLAYQNRRGKENHPVVTGLESTRRWSAARAGQANWVEAHEILDWSYPASSVQRFAAMRRAVKVCSWHEGRRQLSSGASAIQLRMRYRDEKSLYHPGSVMSVSCLFGRKQTISDTEYYDITYHR